jgi:two-component system, response regulator
MSTARPWLHSHHVDILVVDDSDSDAELTLSALSGLHPRPRSLWLSDSREVLDYLMRRRRYKRREPALPSLVLTDFHMPQLSGLELLAQIRAQPQLRSLPVIVLSGNANPADVLECYRLGADGYVAKLISYEIFTAQLTQTAAHCLSIVDRSINP